MFLSHMAQCQVVLQGAWILRAPFELEILYGSEISDILSMELFVYLCASVYHVSCCDRKMAQKMFSLSFQVLYMDAVEYFPDDLQETLDLMTEKELRVRLPMEELDLLLEV